MSVTAQLHSAMAEAREFTLQLLADVDDVDFCRQIHPNFSPLGWHLGHIGVTESFWILQQCKQQPTLSAVYDHFFTPTDNPKPNRMNLPSRMEILDYLHTVRDQVSMFLDTVDFTPEHPLLNAGGIFHMLLQHEEQHNETMLLIKQLLAADEFGDNGIKSGNACHCEERQRRSNLQQHKDCLAPLAMTPELHLIALPFEERGLLRQRQDMVLVPAGPFTMGSDDVATTLDNERPQHEMFVQSFSMDRFPATNAEFLQFVEADGYQERVWWSDEGWRWRTQHTVEHPLYWRKCTNGWEEVELTGMHSLVYDKPVMSVSWYEAEAYARFVRKRLPTEPEWERAAHLGLLAETGKAWEWTSTWFAPYPGFVAHPYAGYSTPYFDNCHRVLRGGSWATRPHVKRVTFRNWYHPWVREIFAGVRCAQDA